jgi:hypothetical protein
MSAFTADTPVDTFVQQNVSSLFSSSVFFLCCHELQVFWLMASLQGWALKVPVHITRVRHITLYSEAEFVAFFDAKDKDVASICRRMAGAIATPSPVPEASVGPVVTTNVTQGNITVPVTVNVTHRTEKPKALPPPPPPLVSRLVERPVAGNFFQPTLHAAFGKEQPIFDGMSDMEVLRKVGWTPVASGGHTVGSKVSHFRNNYMALYVRRNPNAAFTTDLEEEVKKDSHNAYVAAGNAEKALAAGESAIWRRRRRGL